MEPKASHILVGVFLLATLAAVAGFLIWYSQAGAQSDTMLYQTRFRESVTGLDRGGDVTYRGIRIGEVTDIDVNPQDPGLVDVNMEISSRYRLRQGDVATLTLQGITGLTFVNIEGAGPDDPPLPVDPGLGIPVVPARDSEFEQLLEGAPALIGQSTRLVEQVSDIFNARNRQHFDKIMTDVAGLTGQLATSSAQFEQVFTRVDEAGLEIAAAARAINELTGQTHTLFERTDATLANVDGLITSLTRTADTANAMLDADVRVLIDSIRSVAASLTELVEHGLTAIIDELGSASRTVNRVVTDELAPALGQINVTAASLDTVIREDLKGALARIDAAAGSVDALVGDRLTGLVDEFSESAAEDFNAALADLRNAAESVQLVTAEAATMLRASSPAITDFASEGLTDFKRLIIESRQLVTGITRLVDRLEADGATFLLQRRQSEFNPN